jgi:hypothetical protein
MLAETLVLRVEHDMRGEVEDQAVRTCTVLGVAHVDPRLGPDEALLVRISPGLRGSSQDSSLAIIEAASTSAWGSLGSGAIEVGVYSTERDLKPGEAVSRIDLNMVCTALLAIAESELPVPESATFGRVLSILKQAPAPAGGSRSALEQNDVAAFAEDLRRRYILTRLHKDELNPEWETSLNSVPGWTWVPPEALELLSPAEAQRLDALMRKPPLGMRAVSERVSPSPPYPSLRFEFKSPHEALAGVDILGAVPLSVFPTLDGASWLVEFDLPSRDDQERESKLLQSLRIRGGREVGRALVLG